MELSQPGGNSMEDIDWLAHLSNGLRREAELSAQYLQENAALPLGQTETQVVVGTWLPPTDDIVDAIRSVFAKEPLFVLLPEEEARQAIQRIYGAEALTAEQVIADMADSEQAQEQSEMPLDNLRALANEAPIVRLVNLLLLEALGARASDVHLESTLTGLAVRYRVDGVLQDAPSPPARLRAAVISRLKIMAELDIAETRVPQDGRVRLHLRDREVDVRASTVPTIHGESIVLRLLDRSHGRVQLEDLGMGSDTRESFQETISRPHGIVLVTGPTGSGKTTTLYAAVERVRTGREKILTVEDPVEYQLPGINQIPVNSRVGLTFASALRAILRQDPDVMLVGEIRDAETAGIATQAALTGHLVLSTLHTNDAPGALTRLADLDVPAYLITSTVEAVLAQRLVRKTCEHCMRSEPVSERARRAFFPLGDSLEVVYRGQGCSNCRQTGFYGRTGIYELLLLTDDLREQVGRKPSLSELRAIARQSGMKTLREDGFRRVREGVTTPEEVLRVTI
jgi:general secretion pathway protein E